MLDKLAGTKCLSSGLFVPKVCHNAPWTNNSTLPLSYKSTQMIPTTVASKYFRNRFKKQANKQKKPQCDVFNRNLWHIPAFLCQKKSVDWHIKPHSTHNAEYFLAKARAHLLFFDREMMNRVNGLPGVTPEVCICTRNWAQVSDITAECFALSIRPSGLPCYLMSKHSLYFPI